MYDWHCYDYRMRTPMLARVCHFVILACFAGITGSQLDSADTNEIKRDTHLANNLF